MTLMNMTMNLACPGHLCAHVSAQLVGFVQVAVIPQRWQLGFIHGLVRSWLPVQHATPAVWVLVSAIILVLHGADPLGCVSGDGHSWICFLVPVYVQDFCICESRLEPLKLRSPFSNITVRLHRPTLNPLSCPLDDGLPGLIKPLYAKLKHPVLIQLKTHNVCFCIVLWNEVRFNSSQSECCDIRTKILNTALALALVTLIFILFKTFNLDKPQRQCCQCMAMVELRAQCCSAVQDRLKSCRLIAPCFVSILCVYRQQTWMHHI